MVWISRIHADSCRTSPFHRLTCDNRSPLGLVRSRETPPGTPGRRSREGGPRAPAARAGGGAVAVVALVVPVPAGPHGGAGAPADLALRICALGRHSWLPTHRRPVAFAHSPCLSRPPERMWTNAAARGRHQGGTQPMTPHETGATATPGAPPPAAPPPRTFGPQGPTLGDLIDAYRSGPRNLDSGLSEISIVFQAAVPKLVASKHTTSGVRRPSEL